MYVAKKRRVQDARTQTCTNLPCSNVKKMAVAVFIVIKGNATAGGRHQEE